jgi:hypothetical protein
MDTVFANGLISRFIVGNGRTINTTDKVNITGKMVVDTLANGRKV